MAPNVACLQKLTPKVYRKAHEDLISRSHQKKVFISLREKICRQVCIKNFSASLGNWGKNLSHPQKFACSYTYEKASPPPLPFERSEGEMPPSCLHSPATLCIIFYTHSLLVVAVYIMSP